MWETTAGSDCADQTHYYANSIPFSSRQRILHAFSFFIGKAASAQWLNVVFLAFRRLLLGDGRRLFRLLRSICSFSPPLYLAHVTSVADRRYHMCFVVSLSSSRTAICCLSFLQLFGPLAPYCRLTPNGDWPGRHSW